MLNIRPTKLCALIGVFEVRNLQYGLSYGPPIKSKILHSITIIVFKRTTKEIFSSAYNRCDKKFQTSKLCLNSLPN